jgi:hypothetical protein
MFEKATRFTDIFSSDILSKIAFNGNSDKAFIYIVNLNSCKPLIPKLWRCLCVDEKLRAQRYCDSKLSNFYIISRGILRYILSYYIKQSPQEIEFAYKKNIFDKIILESDYLD